MSATVIALCNQKGGTGKSTTTFHLARAAVMAGKRVLVVDCDPQGNLTSVATAEPVEVDQAGLADVLSTRSDDSVADVTVAGVWPGLSVVPTVGMSLGVVRDELVTAPVGREQRTSQALKAVVGEFDLILLDCGPGMDQLTINALVAADAVVIVTESKLFATNGLAGLLGTINDVRSYYNPTLKLAGVVVNKHEGGTVAGVSWLDELGTAAGQGRFTLLGVVPKAAVISDATEAGRGLDEWGGKKARHLSEIYTDILTTITQEISR